MESCVVGHSGHGAQVEEDVDECSGHTGQAVVGGIAGDSDEVGHSGHGVLLGHTGGVGGSGQAGQLDGELVVAHGSGSVICGHAGQGSLVVVGSVVHSGQGTHG